MNEKTSEPDHQLAKPGATDSSFILSPSSFRLGLVPYLNILPLLPGLEETFPADRWVRATPRRLGELLEARQIDIAIVSTFEGLRRGYRLIPGAMIGSDGPVRSVALYSKVPLDQIRSVLLDRASLSSSHLARILAKELLGLDPVYTTSPEPLRTDHDWRSDVFDAFLVIGDVALAWEHAFPYKLDLGEGWQRLTGLPFVFAAWFARPEVTLTPEQEAAFPAARARGEREALRIADTVPEDFAASHGGRESVRHYLTHAIRYTLGEREMAGLRLYEQKLRAWGFL